MPYHTTIQADSESGAVLCYPGLRRRCEMAKRFMYVCLGIIAPTVAFHPGAQYDHASSDINANSHQVM